MPASFELIETEALSNGIIANYKRSDELKTESLSTGQPEYLTKASKIFNNDVF